MGETAASVMTNSVLAVNTETSLVDVQRLFVEEGIHGAPVVDDDSMPVGVITSSDLLRAAFEEHDTAVSSAEYLRELLEFSGPDWSGGLEDFQDRLAQRKASDVMTEGVVTVPQDAPIAEVATVMRDNRIHRVWVEKGGQLCGVISTFDLLELLQE